eukprot:g815.t1
MVHLARPPCRALLRCGRHASSSASSSAVAGREPLLFTPGPLTTSAGVKQAMLVDLGSRDQRMMGVIEDIRHGLLDMAHTSQAKGYECVIMQGSGTFAVESVLSSVVPAPEQSGRLLIASNGVYGERMAAMCGYYGIAHHVLRFSEHERVCADTLADVLREEGTGGAGAFTHVAAVHHETTAGTLNDVSALGAAVREAGGGARFIVDSMSAFGCYDVDVHAVGADYLVSSSNKCIEGVPGFAFALCRREALEADGGVARSLSLDLLEQWRGLEDNGQFRFTPPTHALLAFRQALAEHAAEGGVAGRRARYENNMAVLRRGMAEMGFQLYLDDDAQGCIIATFLQPAHPAFDLTQFQEKLAQLGLVIYPGKLTEADCFRIGSIGRMFEGDMLHLLHGVRHVLDEMGVALPLKQ